MPSFTLLETEDTAQPPQTPPPFAEYVLVEKDAAQTSRPAHLKETHVEGTPNVREVLGGHYYTVFLPSTGSLIHVRQTGALNSAFSWYAHNRGARNPVELRAMRGSRAVVVAAPKPPNNHSGWVVLLKLGVVLGAYVAVRLFADVPVIT